MAGYAFGATYYMRPDGTATSKEAAMCPCNPANYMSMALHNAETFNPGDIVFMDGVFSELMIPPSSGVTYQPVSGGNPVIDGTVNSLDQVFRCVDKDNVTVDGITFTGGAGIIEPMVLFANGTGLTIKNCTITNAERLHLQFRNTVDGVIYGNTIHSSYDPAVNSTRGIFSGQYGADTWGATNLTIYNNTLYNLQLGINVYYAGNSNIYSNTLHALSGSAITLIFSPSGNNIYWNTIYDVCKIIDDTNAIQVGTGIGGETTANVYGNLIYEVYQDMLSGSGIMLDATSRNCNVYRNLIHTVEGAGIQVLLSGGHEIYYNVVKDAGTQSKNSVYMYCPGNIDIHDNILDGSIKVIQ